MKVNTLVKGTIITDSRFLKNNMDLETTHSTYISSLRVAIDGEGLAVNELGKVRDISWNDHEDGEQLRQDFTLILTRTLSKERIYQIINQVQSQPLKFIPYVMELQ